MSYSPFSAVFLHTNIAGSHFLVNCVCSLLTSSPVNNVTLHFTQMWAISYSRCLCFMFMSLSDPLYIPTKPVSDWGVGIRNFNLLTTSKPRGSNVALWCCGNAYTPKYDGHAGCGLVEHATMNNRSFLRCLLTNTTLTVSY